MAVAADRQLALSPGQAAQLGSLPDIRRPTVLSDLLARGMNQMRCSFTVEGEPESAYVLLSPYVFLPVIAGLADLRGQDLFGLPPIADLEQNEQALFGWACSPLVLEPGTQSTLRAAIAWDAALTVMSAQPGGSIECAPLVARYTQSDLLLQAAQLLQRTGRLASAAQPSFSSSPVHPGASSWPPPIQ